MQAVEQTARASYGKLLAILVKATDGDIPLAEDCLAEAFQKALEVWPQTAVPQNPEAWLITTAKNLMIDGLRHQKVQKKNQMDLIDSLLENQESQKSPNFEATSDYRLELLFGCSHPAIDHNVRIALMLQVVMGFKVEDIAGLFLLSAAALEKRLTRAKQKIKLAKIPFSRPDVHEMPERLSDVLEVIYGVFGQSWDSFNEQLEDEAIFLARIVVQLLPLEAEPKGLLSLLLFCKSRKSARRVKEVHVPFFEQDTSRWDLQLVHGAEALLKEAFLRQKLGRFQLEAALQSALVAQKLNQIDTNADVIKLYQALLERVETVGLKVSYAAALIRMKKTEEARKLLAEMPIEEVKKYQPYWVVNAELSLIDNEKLAAKKNFEIAIGLTQDPAIKLFLQSKIEGLCHS